MVTRINDTEVQDDQVTFHRYTVEVEDAADIDPNGYYAVPSTFVSFDPETGAPQLEVDDEGQQIVPDGWVYLDDDYDVADRMLALMICHDRDDAPDHLGGERYRYGRAEYLVLTDTEADNLVERQLESQLDDVLDEVPANLRSYFDRKAWIADAGSDRGSILGSFDGGEDYQDTDACTFYIYRTH